ncbi:MAG: methyltransferase domain-containing protein [Chitinophagia bacterium]|jgi:23S rRNA (cytosine1962-C5)-methyltransferase|nr:methyltransferase domain-containing protein [Chitinophagia bacterium]
MTPEKFQMFENRLLKNYKHRIKQAKRQNISCWRLYDHDLPEFPVCVEIYEDYIYIAEYNRRHSLSDEEHDIWFTETKKCIAGITGLPIENMYVRVRKRMDHKEEQYEKEETLPISKIITVHENGLQFKVNLTDYLDSGLFLDHRITRQMVQAECKDTEFLNLFSYTGSFSVYAAAASAKTVTSVDLSKTYLAWSEENFVLNNLNNKVAYQFIHADVKQYLKTLPANKYDLVVMDPPTFSNSKRMKDVLDIQRDHVELINDVIRIMKPGGILYFSTNFSHFKLDAESIHTKIIKDITKATTPFDFDGRLKRACFKLQKQV